MTQHRPIVISDGDVARFRAKVAPANRDGCELWTASLIRSGYGQMRQNGSMRLAHRVAYTIANGPIPDGALIDHICHVRSCVAVTHLRLADYTSNATNRSGPSAGSSTGIRGVFFNPRRGKWFAQPQLHGRLHWLGCFEDIREAEAVVIAWRREHMPYSVTDQQVSA